MSRTLNLIDLLLNSGRHLCEIGRTQEALDVLNRLASFRQLPKRVIEEIQSLLADLYLRQENYVKARRHLTVAMTLRPLKAEHYHLMGIAIEEDPQADLGRAEMYYAEAVKLDSANPAYWADYAAYLCRIGKSKAGLQAVRKAYVLGQHDVDIVGQVAETLRHEERFEEAETKLRAALFASAGDQRFRQLWQQHQFCRVSAKQQQRGQAGTGTRSKPIILPFTPSASAGKYAELGEKTIRFDPPEVVSEPRTTMQTPVRKPPQKG